MPFNTYTFVVFFTVLLCVHYTLGNWKYQKANLLFASYIFYSAWNPAFSLLLFFSTFCDWQIAKRIYKAKTAKSRKLYLITSLAINLGLLGYFKYGTFLLDNSSRLLEFFGLHYEPLPLDIILPVGISFYTFQTLSYTLDIYRNKLKPGNSFLDYALYVSFFPQLVAGPIVRAGNFLPQCESPRRATQDQFGWGIALMIIGLFMKVIIADTLLGPIVDRVYASPSEFYGIEIWAAVMAFSGQIFCDFSGYSACAIGAALCFGFILPDNFMAPYAALGFQDFWRRWHISLSSWLRDYVYISLGGNRRSLSRTNINIMFTMLIGGLWHGASWLFVLWGGLHACYLILERIFLRLCPKNRKLSFLTETCLIVFTYLVVSLTWIFFRSEDLNTAWTLLVNMISQTQSSHSGFSLSLLEISIALSISVLLFAWHLLRRHVSLEYVYSKFPPSIRALLLFLQVSAIYFFASGDDRAFIYFQF